MSTKEKILTKLNSLINSKYNSPKDAFSYYDKDNKGSLNKKEIKMMLRDADIGGLFRGIVAKELIKGYDKSGDNQINWDEFQVAIKELKRDF